MYTHPHSWWSMPAFIISNHVARYGQNAVTHAGSQSRSERSIFNNNLQLDNVRPECVIARLAYITVTSMGTRTRATFRCCCAVRIHRPTAKPLIYFREKKHVIDDRSIDKRKSIHQSFGCVCSAATHISSLGLAKQPTPPGVAATPSSFRQSSSQARW